MDVLWSPWRYDYIAAGGAKPDGCVFCKLLDDSASDEDRFILKRAEFNFVVLNRYPYASGHLMVVPYRHTGDITALDEDAADELMDLTRRAAGALNQAYQPDGINLGMNLGKAAGAGVAEHLHMHVVPRWVGDANFMTAIGQTRTLPETLPDTYAKLRDKF